MDQTVKNINKGFSIMKSFAERLSCYINIYINKSNELFNILKLDNQEEYSDFLKGLPKSLEQLDILILDIEKWLSMTSDLNLDDTSYHYKTFLMNEIINFDWSILTYLDEHSEQNVINFIKKLDQIDLQYTQVDHNALAALKWMMEYYQNHIIVLQDKISSVKIFDNIRDIKDNIVLIGANGSGKSTFARNLKGKLSDNTTILSAQHLLVYIKPDSISTTNKEMDMVYAFQSSDKLGSDFNLVNLFSNDLNNLIGALFIENAEREHQYYLDNEEKIDSVLIKGIKIWESIIEHRKLIYDRTSIEVQTLEGDVYNFNFLSDGEKAVFYYIAHVLLAKRDSYIIIDEPESHLHLAICNKLWDILELERSDCKFIYLTHNLDFATTRNNKVLLWNKKFSPPSDWEVNRLDEDDSIPERLLMEIVGSRKNILFCEGNDKTSLDFKLYSILYKDYTIIPVGGHINVINYCKAYNRNKDIYGLESIGIIDGDCHHSDQIEKWESENIFTLPINEIENLLCDEMILRSSISRFCCKDDTLDVFKDNFFKKLDKDKGRQSVWYTNNIINNKLRFNMLKEERNLECLINELSDAVNQDEIRNNYEMKLNELSELIKNQDFDGALKVSNFKGALINELPRIIVNDYKDKIFMVIAEDIELQKEIKEKYFSMIKK